MANMRRDAILIGGCVIAALGTAALLWFWPDEFGNIMLMLLVYIGLLGLTASSVR